MKDNLTQNIIQKRIVKESRNDIPLFSLVFAFTLILGLLILIRSDGIWALLIGIVCLVFAGSSFRALLNGLKTKKSVSSDKYCVIQDICVKKHIEETSDPDGARSSFSYYLHFERHGKYLISAFDLVYDEGSSDELLYQFTEPGDSFFLVLSGNVDSPCCVFPEKYWNISLDEFSLTDGVYTPR